MTTEVAYVSVAEAAFNRFAETAPNRLTAGELRHLCFSLGLFVGSDDAFNSLVSLSNVGMFSGWRVEMLEG